jgi:hypothetical protein
VLPGWRRKRTLIRDLRVYMFSADHEKRHARDESLNALEQYHWRCLARK